MALLRGIVAAVTHVDLVEGDAVLLGLAKVGTVPDLLAGQAEASLALFQTLSQTVKITTCLELIGLVLLLSPLH